MKRDKILGSGGQVYNRIDVELDQLIEENFSLQEEERKLTKAVKKIQHKKLAGEGSSAKVKKLTKTIEGRSKSSLKDQGKYALTKTEVQAGEFLLDLGNMRANIEKSTKTIADLKAEVDVLRSHASGKIPSDDLKLQLRDKELQVAQQRARLDDLADSL